MRYFHCPPTYKRKPYGCGFGPVTATTAYLDLGDGFSAGMCPKCKCKLRAYKPKRIAAFPGTCSVTSAISPYIRYCDKPNVSGPFCRRHAYLAHTYPHASA